MKSPLRARRAVQLLGLALAVTVGYRLVVHRLAVNRIEYESGRQSELDEAVERLRWRTDGKAAALREYIAGRATLGETARRFGEFSTGNKWEMDRLRQSWPAASDEQRHAADVLVALARLAEFEKGHEVAYHRAADDYRRTYGELPVLAKL